MKKVQGHLQLQSSVTLFETAFAMAKLENVAMLP